MSSKASRIPSLDGVRGLAALLVLFYRWWQLGGFRGAPWATPALRFAETGVDLFFVLSGFLITRILIAAKDGPHYFRNFYARRVLRIFPLYYLFLVLYYLVLPAFKIGHPIPWSKSVWYWTYLQNTPAALPGALAWGPIHFWSLAVEEHFYLFWPLIVLVVPARHLGKACWGIVAAALLSRWWATHQWREVILHFTPYRMDALAFGALLAYHEWKGSLRRLVPVFWAAFAVSAPMAFYFFGGAGFRGGWMGMTTKFSWVALCYASVLGLILARPGSPWLSWLSAGWLRFTGKISYGLYVFHVLVFQSVIAAVPAARSAPGLLLALGAAYLVCWLSFRFYETPFLEMKKRF